MEQKRRPLTTEACTTGFKILEIRIQAKPKLGGANVKEIEPIPSTAFSRKQYNDL